MPRRSHDDDPLPLEFTEADERRRKVAQLLNWGVSTREMARTIGVSQAQIRRDLTEIRAQLQADALVGLGDRIRLSISKRKMVQLESMNLFHRLPDTYARDKVAALSAYLTAQDAIDKLEGTSAPDAQHAAAIAEAFEVMMASLERVGGQAQVQAFLEDLQRSHRAGTSGLLLGARDAVADFEELDDYDAATVDEDDGGAANGNNGYDGQNG